jgi:thiamine-phosphate pyrophosphorylase
MVHLSNLYYFIDKFDSHEILKLDKKINIIYRNYEKKNNIDDIKKIKKLCKLSKRKFYLANDIKLVLKLKLDGLYIPSFNKSLKVKYIQNKKIEILGSAHNFKEIYFKKKQGVSKLFLSPLFKVRKSKTSIGIIKYGILSKLISSKTIALGGINRTNIKLLKMLNCEGFAAIRYFKNG